MFQKTVTMVLKITRNIQRTIQEITTVVNQFENYAQEVKLNKNTTDYIKKVLIQNKI